jgi:hypothetical protein
MKRNILLAKLYTENNESLEESIEEIKRKERREDATIV